MSIANQSSNSKPLQAQLLHRYRKDPSPKELVTCCALTLLTSFLSYISNI